MHRAWIQSRAPFGTATAVVLLFCFATNGYTQEDPPAIPVAELPPFPEVEVDDPTPPDEFNADEVAEDVVVGASKREQSLGSVASAVTLISSDQIKRFGFRTVSEAINTVSGIFIVDDRMIERVGIRGVQLLGDANTRILVLIDGSPLNEPWSQYVDTSYALPIHLDDVARIEVIRGPVSSIYGTNAFLGIINIVTLSADKAPPVYARVGGDSFGSVTGNAGFGYGTVDRQVRANIAWVRRGAEELQYDQLDTADPDFQFNTDADRLDALNGAVQAHYDRLFFQVRGHTRDRKLPGAPYDSVIDTNITENRDSQVLGELGYNYEFSKEVSLSGRLYLDRYQFRGLLRRPDDPLADESEIVTFESRGNSLWYGGEVRGLLDLSGFMPANGKLDLTAGVSAEFSRTDSESFTQGSTMDPVEIDTPFNTQGLYTEVNIEPFSWLAATAGVRFDRNSQFENNTSPRIALFLKRDEKIGAKFLYAEGFRNPSIFEAFFEDGERYLPGPGLRPERITSYEAVAWGRPLPGVKVRLSLWQWDVEDLIEKRSVLSDLVEQLQYHNLAGLQSQGFEVEGTYRDTAGWFGYANVSLAKVSRNEDTSFNAPAVVAKGGLSTPSILDTVHLSSDVSFVSERQTRDDDVVAEAHVAWNAAIYVPDLKGFDLTLGVRNLLGKRQQVPAQDDYDRQNPRVDVLLVPGPGREFFARLGYRL